jgi:hypothetical protein
MADIFDKPSKSADLKSQIHYARYGRALNFKKINFILQFVLSILVFETILFKYINSITYYIAIFASYFIKQPHLDSEKFLNFHIFYTYSVSQIPKTNFCIILIIISIILILFLYKQKFIIKLFSMWLILFFMLILLSSIYFLLFGKYFPYAIKDFSILYIKLQIGIFVMIPIIIGLPLALFSFNYKIIMLNIVTMIIALIYSILFGSIRYALFLFILSKYSVLWMSSMFFLFGPLMDFTYIVAIFSLYVSLVSKAYNKSLSIWRWVA